MIYMKLVTLSINISEQYTTAVSGALTVTLLAGN